MPRGDQSKEPAFQMWLQGRPLQEIQEVLCGESKTLPSNVEEWVRDWERGAQGSWTPDLGIETSRDLRRKSLLRRLQTQLEQFSNYYFLWLIAARIALWTREPVELNQAHDMMDRSLAELDRIAGLIRQNRLEFSEPIQGLLTELLEAAEAGDFQPTADLFNQKTQEIRRIGEELKGAIHTYLA